MDELSSSSRLPMPSQLPQKNGAKRRSLLLPPGTISGGLRKGLLSPTEEDAPKQRPVTMMGMGMVMALPRTLQTTKEEIEHDSADTWPSPPPSPNSRDAGGASALAALVSSDCDTHAPPPRTTTVPKTGMVPTASLKAPPSSRIGMGKPAPAKMARPLSVVKETTARPLSVASTSSKSSTEPAPVVARLRAPAPKVSATAGLRNPNTTSSNRHSRTQSALAPTSSTSSVTTAQPPRRHPTISEGTTEIKSQLRRPDFNTNQQHFSPKKNLAPKPASSSIIHAAPPDTGSYLGLETQLLQTRLLQLALLHKQAEPTLQAWTRSARRALKRKFTDVAAECEIIQQKERLLRQHANMAVLREWCKGDVSLLGEQIFNLSALVEEIMHLLDDNGGRVSQALDMFEAWITWVEAVYASRGARHADFVEGLGEGWKSEVIALLRKLQGLSRQLDGLGDCAGEGGKGSLAGLVGGLRDLTRGAAEELRLVQGLEAEVVRKEARWVDEQMVGILGEIDALLLA